MTVTKLVHGGQGLGVLSDGRKVFVWNALPGERVRVRIIRRKRSYAEAIAEEVLEASSERIPAEEENYLATSPWQIMTFAAENRYKRQIVEELFQHEKVALPEPSGTISDDRQWHYRNKMEYSFWGDDDGLHLALHRRGSHGKQIVQGSKLALPALDTGANSICMQLSRLGVRAGDLKTIVVRCSQPHLQPSPPCHPGLDPGSSKKGAAAGHANSNWIPDRGGKGGAGTVAALFVKPETFPRLELPKELQGLRVYHSNPKSPASVPTRLLYESGDPLLHDELLGKPYTYDVDSFFQVNVPVFELVLARIKQYCEEPCITDMYAGVGSIGLSIARQAVDLVELDPATAKMCGLNAAASGLTARVIETSSEKALEFIAADKPVIFDPPRAGLHDRVAAHVLEVLPPKVIYLSCNPATQARDLAKLQTRYKIRFFEVYNFFPRTPHIETLAVLETKS